MTLDFSWLGRERYYVGHALVFEHRSLELTGTRQFTAEGHSIRIVIRTSLRKLTCQAYVDGSLKADELFSELHQKFKKRYPWWAYALIWFAIAFASFAITVLLRR